MLSLLLLIILSDICNTDGDDNVILLFTSINLYPGSTTILAVNSNLLSTISILSAFIVFLLVAPSSIKLSLLNITFLVVFMKFLLYTAFKPYIFTSTTEFIIFCCEIYLLVIR